MVRRRLNFTIDEWENLPWWQQTVYMDGLYEEFYTSEEDEDSDDESLDDLKELGVQVREVSAPPE